MDRCTAFAVHPARIAVSVMLLLPDRHAMLHFVDDVAAGVEGFAPMDRTDPDPPRHVAQGQGADAMDAQRVLHREAPQSFGDDAFAFLQREFLKGFVFQSNVFPPPIVIPHPAFKTDVGAGSHVEDLAPPGRGVDRGVGKAEAHQPPATGGMKTTAPPTLSRRDQSLNSLLTATFS